MHDENRETEKRRRENFSERHYYSRDSYSLCLPPPRRKGIAGAATVSSSDRHYH